MRLVASADSNHVLSSIVSSLVRISLAGIFIQTSALDGPPMCATQSSSSALPASSPVSLLRRLCTAIHNAHSLYSWGVADWALRRASDVAARLRQASATEYAQVIRALERQPEVAVPPSLNASTAPEPFGVVDEGTLGTPGAAEAALRSIQELELDGWLNVLDEERAWGDVSVTQNWNLAW
jgi:hypothetical protein